MLIIEIVGIENNKLFICFFTDCSKKLFSPIIRDIKWSTSVWHSNLKIIT